MKVIVKIRDGQLEATAEADMNDGMLDLEGIDMVGSALSEIAQRTLFDMLGGSDGHMPPLNN